jgi:hypothetical protein
MAIFRCKLRLRNLLRPAKNCILHIARYERATKGRFAIYRNSGKKKSTSFDERDKESRLKRSKEEDNKLFVGSESIPQGIPGTNAVFQKLGCGGK